MPPNALFDPQQQPLRPALRTGDEDRAPAGSIKAVQIHEPEATPQEDPSSISPTKRQFTAHLAGRRHAKPHHSNHSTSSLSPSLRPSLASPEGSPALPYDDLSGNRSASENALGLNSSASQSPRHGSHRGQRYYAHKLVSQLSEWIEHEKRKMESRKGKRLVPSRRRKSKSPPSAAQTGEPTPEKHGSSSNGSSSSATPAPSCSRPRSDSIDSNSSEVSLDRLQRIIEGSMAAMGLSSVSELSLNAPRLRRTPSRKKLMRPVQRTVSSDTEYHDGDVVVPSCDALLDNSRTLAYSGGGVGAGASTEDLPATSREQKKARQAWLTFKNEIVRLAHTLRLKGWRRVPLDSGEAVAVERLSGALTNAVYVVSPPADIVRSTEAGKKPPPKLLLRIYGPNVDTLIDREQELGVLRRLARKKIGPRLLGTFTNGRFEQYLNSTTLTPSDIRQPETSRSIAKRMRELHDGIVLLPEEREAGPALWKNWAKWLDSVEARVLFLDDKVRNGTDGGLGYVCGVEWQQFRRVVDKYREYIKEVYGSSAEIKNRLVFAHNDTQYGNILRVRPDDETSPLLQPENQHRQLVVIDFEYAAPNTIGYEFANHFTEWTYNYHDTTAPHQCNSRRYPTLEEQRRFVRSYVEHKSKTQGMPGTPRLGPIHGDPSSSPAPSNTIVEFMLDARVPPGGWKEAERVNQEMLDKKVDELLGEARLWRPGCSVKWIAWGIVQAKIKGLPSEAEAAAAAAADKKGEDSSDGGASVEGGQVQPRPPAEDEDAEFDYLAYAKERVMFFWGDCLRLGIVREEDLPEDLARGLKLVDY